MELIDYTNKWVTGEHTDGDDHHDGRHDDGLRINFHEVGYAGFLVLQKLRWRLLVLLHELLLARVVAVGQRAAKCDKDYRHHRQR